jgi:hypothetical protein
MMMTESHMSESPQSDGHARRRGSLLGFYIAAFLLLLLVGAAALFWMPLKMAYFERQVRNAVDDGSRHPTKISGTEYPLDRRTWAAHKLIQCGHVSHPTLERLFRLPGDSDAYVLNAISLDKEPWTLPLVIEFLSRDDVVEGIDAGAEGKAAKRGDVIVHKLHGKAVARLVAAITAVEGITGRSFLSEDPEKSVVDAMKEARQSILTWWDKEGVAGRLN